MREAATPLEALEEVARLARECGASQVAGDASWLIERLHEGRFYLACFGQFKRGKSTLINALVGEELLPAGVVPVTSVVTVVRFGAPRVRVRLGSGDWGDVTRQRLTEFVSEAHNPENQRGVTGVEVFCTSQLLEHGLCLVDTPGLGSIFEGNSREARAFIPQVDAALVVLGGDPPISGEELELVGSLGERVRDILVVINKADRLADEDRRQARKFTERALAERCPGAATALFEVSALEKLQGNGPDRDWPALVARIQDLSENAGALLVERAAETGLAALAARLRRRLVEQRDALLRPGEESERRLAHLRRCVADAEQSLIEFRHLLDAEQGKLERKLEQRRRDFVQGVLPELLRDVHAAVREAPAAPGPKLRHLALDHTQDLAEARVRKWRAEQQPAAEREFAQITERFVNDANALLQRLRDSGEIPAEVLPGALQAETGLNARSQYSFQPFARLATPSVGTWLVDLLRTEKSARAAVARSASAFALRLIDVNSRRLINDFRQRIIESRRHVEAELRRRLGDIATTAEEAAQRATQVKERGHEAVRVAIEEIARQLAALDSIEDTRRSDHVRIDRSA